MCCLLLWWAGLQGKQGYNMLDVCATIRQQAAATGDAVSAAAADAIEARVRQVRHASEPPPPTMCTFCCIFVACLLHVRLEGKLGVQEKP